MRQYRVIINDRLVSCPRSWGVANPSAEADHREMLDDERFPLILTTRARRRFRDPVRKISYPTGGELEEHLAIEKRVDVYGIYFDFASDQLRPESTPVLSEIAAALAKNADWKLSINGHTDNIGGDASNLDLSRRRSESVRRELIEQYRVDPARLVTAGFGASQPKESNATVEGRGKNRRVELVRQ